MKFWHFQKTWTLNNPGNEKTDRTEIKFRFYSDFRDCFLSPEGFKFFNTFMEGGRSKNLRCVCEGGGGKH